MKQKKNQKILLIGAGGAGVSNIAQIYQEQGYEVVGCDKIKNIATDNLEQKGVKICLDSQEGLLDNVNIVFRSAAIKDDHKLIIEAKNSDIPIISRYELFEELSEAKDIIAIAGSSGKTSTTGITAHILQGHEDCGYLIGIHGNGGHFGTTNSFVLEADEYARTFLYLKKTKMALITGVKYDHVDIYKTQEEYNQAFVEFASKAKILVINGDDPKLSELTKNLKPITYGNNTTNDFVASNIKNFEGGSSFDILHQSKILANIKLQVIGGHNVINALAGFVINYLLNIPIDTIVKRLEDFKGLPRRLELVKTTPYIIYNDYAHLPFEIATVLAGLRESYPNRRILCYFQGHTYTRINAFFDDYSKALSNCDYLFLGDIYASRDSSGSVDLTRLLDQVSIENKVLSGNPDNTKELIKVIIQDGDVLIVMSAGDGNSVAYGL